MQQNLLTKKLTPLIDYSRPIDQLDYKWEKDLQFQQGVPNRYRSSLDNSKRNIQYIHQINRSGSIQKTSQENSNIFSDSFNPYKNSNEYNSKQLQEQSLVEPTNVVMNNTISSQKLQQNSNSNSLLDTYIPISAKKAREAKLNEKFQKTKGSFYTTNMSGKNFNGIKDVCLISSKGINYKGRQMVKEISMDRHDIFGKTRVQVKENNEFQDFYNSLKTQGQHPDRLRNKFKHLLYGKEYCKELEKNNYLTKIDKQIQFEEMSSNLIDVMQQENEYKKRLTVRNFRGERSISSQVQKDRRNLTMYKIQNYKQQQLSNSNKSLIVRSQNQRNRGLSVDGIVQNRNINVNRQIGMDQFKQQQQQQQVTFGNNFL